MFKQQSSRPAATLETVRKHSRILVIDDLEFPLQSRLEDEGYHLERWAEIKRLNQLTEGHYQLILLDIQGVGTELAGSRQGLGVLEHIKTINPAQAVILYSSSPYGLSDNETVNLADASLNKSAPYVQYQQLIDRLLVAQASPDYYIEHLQRLVGGDERRARKVLKLARKAIEGGSQARLESQLSRTAITSERIELALRIVRIGAEVTELLAR